MRDSYSRIGLPTAHDLPALALGNREILWSERTLTFFYSFLLLFVPLARGLEGQLPIELSTRGARWQETTVESERVTGALNRRVDDLIREFERTAGVLPELSGRLVDLDALVSPRPRSSSRRRRG